jgi:hypothetical protein
LNAGHRDWGIWRKHIAHNKVGNHAGGNDQGGEYFFHKVWSVTGYQKQLLCQRA